MTIGPDIDEAIEEVGTAFTVIRDSGNVTGEYLFFKPNQQVTKPFIREFFLEAWLVYNTSAVAGDIIEFNKTANKYIIMNLTPYLFENEIIKYDGVLYKTNVTATILRMSQFRNAQYHMETRWSVVKADTDLLLTTALFGHDLDSDEQIAMLGIERHEMYAPSSIGIKVHDRIKLSATEYFRVENVKKRRYQNVDVFDIGEDTRPWTTTTTTTSSTTTTTA